MSIYSNGLNININEVAVLTFLENINGTTSPVCQVAMTYEVLKQIHVGIGSAIEQHNARLGYVMSDMGRAN